MLKAVVLNELPLTIFFIFHDPSYETKQTKYREASRKKQHILRETIVAFKILTLEFFFIFYYFVLKMSQL